MKKLKSLLGWPLRKIRSIVKEELAKFSQLVSKDIALECQNMARNDTANYVQEKMSHIDSLISAEALLDLALSTVKISGMFLEFGVYSGRSINLIASRIDQNVYGFDSFRGLPERWRDGFSAGVFETDVLPTVASNVILVKGIFSESLPEFLEKNDEKVSFIHIDCDLYSSTKQIFDSLADRFTPGTIIVFDEYFNYPGWREGEYKAFQEFVQKWGVDYEYIGYNSRHEQVAVVILGIQLALT